MGVDLSGVPHGTDRGGVVYTGRGEEMVIGVGARTTPNCLKGAGRIRGSQEKMTNAVNGDKTRSE